MKKQRKEVRSKTSPKTALELPMLNGVFYRDGYRTLWKLTYILAAIALFSMGLNLFQFENRPQPVAYAVTPALRVVRMQPLTSRISPASIRKWADNTIVKCYSLDFVNYRKQLNDLEPEFTHAGFRGYLQALKNAKTLKYIESDDYVMTATPTGIPSIVREGVEDGRYSWVIQIPIMVNYQAAGNNNQQKMLVRIIAVRAPRSRIPSGVLINNLIASRQ